MDRARMGFVTSLLGLMVSCASGCGHEPAASASAEDRTVVADQKQISSSAASQSSQGNALPKSVAKPLFDGWKKPAAVLVLSGEQHGFFEPCGCAEHQSGGFARREKSCSTCAASISFRRRLAKPRMPAGSASRVRLVSAVS